MKKHFLVLLLVLLTSIFTFGCKTEGREPEAAKSNNDYREEKTVEVQNPISVDIPATNTPLTQPEDSTVDESDVNDEVYKSLSMEHNANVFDTDCPVDAIKLGERIADLMDTDSFSLYAKCSWDTISIEDQQTLVRLTTPTTLPDETSVRELFISLFGVDDAVTKEYLNEVTSAGGFFGGWDPPFNHYVCAENCHLVKSDDKNGIYSFSMLVCVYDDATDYITTDESWKKRITGTIRIDTRIFKYNDENHLILTGFSYIPDDFKGLLPCDEAPTISTVDYPRVELGKYTGIVVDVPDDYDDYEYISEESFLKQAIIENATFAGDIDNMILSMEVLNYHLWLDFADPYGFSNEYLIYETPLKTYYDRIRHCAEEYTMWNLILEAVAEKEGLGKNGDVFEKMNAAEEFLYENNTINY